MIKMLNTVLKIEDDSKAIIEDAQQQAREFKEQAEKENSERLDTARKDAASSLMTSIQNAKQEWDDKYQRTLASQNAVYSDFVKSKKNEIENTADKVLALVQKPRYERFDE